MGKNRFYPNLEDKLILGKFWKEKYIPAMQAFNEAITVAPTHRRGVQHDLLLEVAEWFKESHIPAKYQNSITVKHLVDRYLGVN